MALSLALAVLSYTRWESKHQAIKFKELINQPAKQTWLNISGALFSAGLATTADKTWEQILWIIMIILFLVQIVALYFPIRKP